MTISNAPCTAPECGGSGLQSSHKYQESVVHIRYTTTVVYRSNRRSAPDVLTKQSTDPACPDVSIEVRQLGKIVVTAWLVALPADDMTGVFFARGVSYRREATKQEKSLAFPDRLTT
jgi:hypothetical protein